MRKTNNQKGITLIGLIITVVVLLILAVVAISALRNDGIIGYAKNAKEQSEIAKEKEKIKLSITSIRVDNMGNKIGKEELQRKLEEEMLVMTDEDEYVIRVNSSNRYYRTIDKKDIEGPIEIIIDNSKSGFEGNGTEESPYVIMSIEDLMEWSKNYSLYKNSFFELGRNLDFNSELSYCDYETTEYNTFLGINNTEIGLLECLTNKKYSGFNPINTFCGELNGNYFSIKNMYINRESSDRVGFIATVNNNIVIKNLKLHGEVIGSTDNVGGYIGYSWSNLVIENCINEVKVYSTKTAGGFVGYVYPNGIKIINSINLGDVEVESGNAGGFIGASYRPSAGQTMKIELYNNINFGDISSEYSASGFVGVWSGYDFTFNCYNCINVGNVSAKIKSGIIVAGGWPSSIVYNVNNAFLLKELSLKGYTETLRFWRF